MLKLASAILAMGLSLSAAATELVIETWRGEDVALWQQKILPVFEAQHPDIHVTLSASESSQYGQVVSERLKAGKAGDLITCRPFDESLALFKAGHLQDITELPGMENFPRFAKSAWQTDTGAQVFCLPIASVIQGFFYNKTIFTELGLSVPKTRAQFFAALAAIKQDGRYLPLAIAADNAWGLGELSFQGVGPNYWRGEDGRLALIQGKQKLTDPAYVDVFRELAQWGDYVGDKSQPLTDAQVVDLFGSGKAAIMLGGSWAISQFMGKVDFDAFPPPVAREGDDCFFVDHTDMGIAINTASPNQEAAMKLVEWMTGAEFASLFSNQVPGFFSLSNHFFELDNPVAATMAGWREQCDSTLRLSTQILSRGAPSLGVEVGTLSQAVVLGAVTPEAATQRLQQGLQSWYLPQQLGDSGSETACQPAPAAPTTEGKR